jgi:hypothetical protein
LWWVGQSGAVFLRHLFQKLTPRFTQNPKWLFVLWVFCWEFESRQVAKLSVFYNHIGGDVEVILLISESITEVLRFLKLVHQWGCV